MSSKQCNEQLTLKLIEKLMNGKHDILSYKEAKKRRECDAPGIGGIGKNSQISRIAV